MNIDYCRRLMATGLAFVAFGIGGLVLSVFVFPPLYLVFGSRQKTRARRIIHHSFRLFMVFLETLGLIRWDVTGAEKLRNCRNVLVLANHPTLIDVVALIALIPDASCVVKQALWRNPLVGCVVRAAGYISNDQPERLIQACAEDLATGAPLVIFPEGTRSVPGEPLHFLRGASYILLGNQLEVLPVLIHCAPLTLTKNERWYQIPPRRAQLTLQVLDPRAFTDLADAAEPRPLAARRLTVILENYFLQELHRHGYAQA